jgi:hypothetical protein
MAHKIMRLNLTQIWFWRPDLACMWEVGKCIGLKNDKNVNKYTMFSINCAAITTWLKRPLFFFVSINFVYVNKLTFFYI